MQRKILVFTFLLILGVAILSGCTSEPVYSGDGSDADSGDNLQAANSNGLDSQLSDAIDAQLNPEKYVSYMEISNLNVSDQKVSLSYVTYAATTDNAVYGQMLKIIRVITEFFNTQPQKPQTISLDTVDRSDNIYKITLSWDYALKFANGDLGLSDLQAMAASVDDDSLANTSDIVTEQTTEVATLNLWLASPENWDADAETDGIEVTISPKNSADRLVKENGTVSAKFYWDIGLMDYKKGSLIQEWTDIPISEDDYDFRGAKVRLEYSPDFDLSKVDSFATGILELTFKTTDGSEFNAKDDSVYLKE